MNNKKYEHELKRVFNGTFPMETTEVESKTPLLDGDIVGVSATYEFGKIGTAYPNVYGVAYDALEEPGLTSVILTGSLHKDFVKIETAKEKEYLIKLREKSIFVK
ncbi:MAG: hypothetical protein ACRC6K_08845 [Fusobacteriaceae bacterium]